MSIKKKILIILGLGVAIAISVALYMYYMPARDVQATKTDYSFKASAIVKEYLTDPEKANQKYLDDEGESKVLEITGIVADISEDFNKQKVILLKSDTDKAGVKAIFTSETSKSTEGVNIGDEITIKGVIRSGASYDEDLGMYEHVILEKSDIITQ